MWLFTLDGFYSVVADRDDPSRLLVRARDSDDALHMADRFAQHGHPVDVLDTPDHDYAYRMFVPRETFAAVLSEEATGLRYTNFKNAIAEQRGYRRASLYGQVWALLRTALQQETK